MIHFVVCSGLACASGRRLAEQITIVQGHKCRYRNQGRIRHPELRHIRYGSHRETSDNCLNRLEAVQLASNKLKALQKLKESDVRVPEFQTSDNYTRITNYRRIFRRNYRHAANDSPLILEPNVSGPSCLGHGCFDYCMKYITPEKEFRVHVFKDVAFLYQERVPRGGVDPHPYIRSVSDSWKLSTKSTPPRPDGVLATIAVKSVTALGLDFGAVDVVMDEGCHYYVLEVNTAPGLSDNKARKYAQLMVNWDQGRVLFPDLEN